MIAAFRELTSAQRKTFLASFLGWTLDAFDFFLVTFVAAKIATDLHRSIPEVFGAVTLTLMMRPLGALIFGYFADKYGRRIPLMVDIALFSLIELLTAFSPNFSIFLILRAIYGVAMGGEWGLGAALAMEALPPKSRGLFSGLLQEGYMVGYLLAALVFGFAFDSIGWRGMFAIGVLPALLIFFIRKHVPESDVWVRNAHVRLATKTQAVISTLKSQWVLIVYAVLFMAAFNYMSHGTQDLYATFLQKQHGFDPHTVTLVSALAAIGAIIGGIAFGGFSQRFGRRNSIVVAAVLGMALIPLWAFSHTTAMIAVGGFLMQFMVQGAWGIIPAHLNELSPGNLRGTFPGFTYQIGNLISANAAQLEATFATHRFPLPSGHPDYAKALSIIALGVFIAVILLTLIGYVVKPERRDANFATACDGRLA